MRTEFISVTVTCASKKEARLIANALLKRRLIACATILAYAESLFWWRGKLEKSREVLVVMKTRRAHYAYVEKLVKSLHSYECPEVIAFKIEAGSADYLRWIDSSASHNRSLR
jgi:periplasmic divalent cation tolerance protein